MAEPEVPQESNEVTESWQQAVQAVLAIVLLDHYLRHRAQNADVVSGTPDITRDEKNLT